jgi:hypothetical protein
LFAFRGIEIDSSIILTHPDLFANGLFAILKAEKIFHQNVKIGLNMN